MAIKHVQNQTVSGTVSTSSLLDGEIAIDMTVSATTIYTKDKDGNPVAFNDAVTVEKKITDSVNDKVSSQTIKNIEVVSELPENPDEDTLYIVK